MQCVPLKPIPNIVNICTDKIQCSPAALAHISHWNVFSSWQMSRKAYFSGKSYLGSTAKISPFDNFEGGLNFRTLQPSGLLFYHNEGVNTPTCTYMFTAYQDAHFQMQNECFCNVKAALSCLKKNSFASVWRVQYLPGEWRSGPKQQRRKGQITQETIQWWKVTLLTGFSEQSEVSI